MFRIRTILCMAILTLGCLFCTTDMMAQDKKSKKDAKKKPVPFEKNIIYNSMNFKVSSPGIDSGNTVTITPTGLNGDNKPIVIELGGTVHEILTGDIDGDSWPELIVWETAADKIHQVIHGYTVNNGRFLIPFTTTNTGNKDALADGYGGFDEFNIGNNVLLHRFPIVKGGKPTKKTRQLQYSLLTTDDAKQLWYEKSIEF